MLSLSWPSAAHISDWRLNVEGHTRGVASAEGAGTYSRGSGARFVGSVDIAPLTLTDALTFRAFLHRLRGRAGSFYMPVPGADGVTGTAVTSGTTAADASSVTLASITSSAYLVPGCFLAIGDLASGGQLVRAVTVSGSVVTFRPRLRAAISGGTAVSFGLVNGLFRLAKDTPVVAIRPDVCPGLSLEIEEFR